CRLERIRVGHRVNLFDLPGFGPDADYWWPVLPGGPGGHRPRPYRGFTGARAGTRPRRTRKVRGHKYFTNRTAFPRSLYKSSSTRFRVIRMPNPPGRLPSSARISTWRIGESSGFEIAAWGRKSMEKPLPGS